MPRFKTQQKFMGALGQWLRTARWSLMHACRDYTRTRWFWRVGNAASQVPLRRGGQDPAMDGVAGSKLEVFEVVWNRTPQPNRAWTWADERSRQCCPARQRTAHLQKTTFPCTHCGQGSRSRICRLSALHLRSLTRRSLQYAICGDGTVTYA